MKKKNSLRRGYLFLEEGDFSWVGTYIFFFLKKKQYSSTSDMTFFAKKGKFS